MGTGWALHRAFTFLRALDTLGIMTSPSAHELLEMVVFTHHVQEGRVTISYFYETRVVAEARKAAIKFERRCFGFKGK